MTKSRHETNAEQMRLRPQRPVIGGGGGEGVRSCRHKYFKGCVAPGRRALRVRPRVLLV